jgi:hypothetical protein
LGKERIAVWNPFKAREYQVVLEFHGDDPQNFDRVMALEAKLEEEIESGEVDGNDVGQGIVNIFIITKEPTRCFEEAMGIIGGAGEPPRAAGYRDLDEEDYVRLWPKDDSSPFELK